MSRFNPSNDGIVYTPILDFPEYKVGSNGHVYNSFTGRTLILSNTEAGDPTVGLIKDGVQYRRSVKVLVAQAFISGETPLFNTPIQLDGNKQNLNADNIIWRPRWFAWKYTRQFSNPLPWYEDGMIQDNRGRRYHTILEASMINGVLCEDIRNSLQYGSYVFPTAQIFSIF